MLGLMSESGQVWQTLVLALRSEGKEMTRVGEERGVSFEEFANLCWLLMHI